MKRVDLPTGVFNIAAGFKIVLAQESKVEEQRYLNALKGRIEDAYGFDLEDMKSIKSPDIVNKLNNFLKSQDISDGYRRNLASRLYKVLRQSPQLEDLSYIREAWIEKLKEKVPLDSLRSQAMLYWFEYVEKEKRMPEVATQAVLTAFADYLAEEKGLARHGSAYERRKTVRDILKLVNLFDVGPDRSVNLHPMLAEQLNKVEEFGLNNHLSEEDKKSLFLDERGGNSREINKATIKKLKYQVHSWVRFATEIKKIEITRIEDILRSSFIREYLDHCYQEQSITKQTAASCLDNSKSLARLGTGAKVLNISLDQFRLEINKLYLPLKKFKKDGINAKLEKQGGLPSFKELHANWVANLREARPKWAEVFSEIDGTMRSAEMDSLIRKHLLDLRGAILIGLSLFISPRSGDFVNIKVEDFRKVSKYWQLSFVPEKTDHHFNAPKVDASLPPWFTGLIDDYMLLRRFLNEDSDYFIPPSKYHHLINNIASDNNQKGSVSYVQFEAYSKKWLNVELSTNRMRKILATAYNMYGLQDLYQTAGHSVTRTSREDRGGLTEIESAHYLIGNDELIKRKAMNKYSMLMEELEIDRNENLSFLPNKAAKKLKAWG